MHIDLGDIWKQEREIERRPETRDLLVSYKKEKKMKLILLWICLTQSAKILVWPAEWSHWINMKVRNVKMLTIEVGRAECIVKVHHCLLSNEQDNMKLVVTRTHKN